MIDRERLIREISELIADKILELDKCDKLQVLPTNVIHFERSLMSLEGTTDIVKYQVSDYHGYSIAFEKLSKEEQVQGAVGVFCLKVLHKDPFNNKFLSSEEKRIFLFPNQVSEVLEEESLNLQERTPSLYKLLNEDQFYKWS